MLKGDLESKTSPLFPGRGGGIGGDGEIMPRSPALCSYQVTSGKSKHPWTPVSPRSSSKPKVSFKLRLEADPVFKIRERWHPSLPGPCRLETQAAQLRTGPTHNPSVMRWSQKRRSGSPPPHPAHCVGSRALGESLDG